MHQSTKALYDFCNQYHFFFFIIMSKNIYFRLYIYDMTIKQWIDDGHNVYNTNIEGTEKNNGHNVGHAASYIITIIVISLIIPKTKENISSYVLHLFFKYYII